MNGMEEKQSYKKYFISADMKKKCYYRLTRPFKSLKIIVVSKVNRNVLHRYTFTAQTPDELAEVVADFMSMPPKSAQTDTLLTMVQNLFKGIESMVNKGYSWSEIADRFIELYPDAPVAPGTLRNYWYKLRADAQGSKKASHRSASNRWRSLPERESPHLASTQTPQKETPIARLSSEVTPVSSAVEPVTSPVAVQIISEELETALVIPDYRDQLGVEHFLTALETLKTIDPNRWRQLMCEARNADVNVTGTIARRPSQINALFNQY